MATLHVVDEAGRYDGLTLREASPFAAAQIVEAFESADRRTLMRSIREAIRTFLPAGIVVADLAETVGMSHSFDGATRDIWIAGIMAIRAT